MEMAEQWNAVLLVPSQRLILLLINWIIEM